MTATAVLVSAKCDFDHYLAAPVPSGVDALGRWQEHAATFQATSSVATSFCLFCAPTLTRIVLHDTWVFIGCERELHARRGIEDQFITDFYVMIIGYGETTIFTSIIIDK